MLELGGEGMRVVLGNLGGGIRITTASDLLPGGFRLP
jgi:hypothetical protein